MGKIFDRKTALGIVNEVVSMNNKWEKDCYYCVLSYMLVQTIQCDFDEGTEDLIKTLEKLLEFPIQPLKRAYMQTCFQSDTPPQQPQPSITSPQPVVPKATPNLNTSTNQGKKVPLKNPRRSKSTQKKLVIKEKGKSDKEKDMDRKMRMYLDHIIYYQKLNGMDINPYGNTRFLKFVIGKGNNSLLSRISLKTRWWWSETKKSGFNYNFIWTQWKSRKTINHLPKLSDEVNKQADSKDTKDDTARNSDTDDLTTNQSTSETLATPSSRKMSRINSDSLTRKLDTPESQSRSDNKAGKNGAKSLGVKPEKEPMDTENTIICNHVDGHVHLSNKKALFYNMRNYYESIGENPYKFIPLTFHIQENLEDKEFERFTEEFKRLEEYDQDQIDNKKDKKSKPKPTNIWIIKPGENTNRGSGIRVCNKLEEISSIGKKYIL